MSLFRFFFSETIVMRTSQFTKMDESNEIDSDKFLEALVGISDSNNTSLQFVGDDVDEYFKVNTSTIILVGGGCTTHKCFWQLSFQPI